MTTALTTRRKQTTTRIGGRKVRIVTTNGKTVVTEAPIEEYLLQAEAVRRLRQMPEYAATAGDVTARSFTLAADFNAGKRDAVKAKATGVTAGETDIRIYAAAARLLLIEYKNAEGRLSADQVARHALLRALGYRVEVIKATTPTECADRTEALVRGWLLEGEAANEPTVPLKAVQDLLAAPAPHSPRRYIYDKTPERRIWANDKLDESISGLAANDNNSEKAKKSA